MFSLEHNNQKPLLGTLKWILSMHVYPECWTNASHKITSCSTMARCWRFKLTNFEIVFFLLRIVYGLSLLTPVMYLKVCGRIYMYYIINWMKGYGSRLQVKVLIFVSIKYIKIFIFMKTTHASETKWNKL